MPSSSSESGTSSNRERGGGDRRSASLQPKIEPSPAISRVRPYRNGRKGESSCRIRMGKEKGVSIKILEEEKEEL